MSHAFDAMSAVRAAHDACLKNPGDAAAAQYFKDLHQLHEGTFVDAFEVAGISYPRTDGHRLSESQARTALSAFLADDGLAADVKPGVLAAAYPHAAEVLREEIESIVQSASEILALDWQSAQLDGATVARLRDLLRMPTEAGAFDQLKDKVKRPGGDGPNPYRGFNVDHLIPDQDLRGLGVSREQSLTLEAGFSTFLLDGQNRGSQHKYATDCQAAVRKHFRTLGRNPTLGEYLAYAKTWMTKIYVTADLVVDGLVNEAPMAEKLEFSEMQVKGYAMAQAGFMTWPERQLVGEAVATALVIQARDHYASLGWPLTQEMKMVRQRAAVRGAVPSVKAQA